MHHFMRYASDTHSSILDFFTQLMAVPSFSFICNILKGNHVGSCHFLHCFFFSLFCEHHHSCSFDKTAGIFVDGVPILMVAMVYTGDPRYSDNI